MYAVQNIIIEYDIIHAVTEAKGYCDCLEIREHLKKLCWPLNLA